MRKVLKAIVSPVEMRYKPERALTLTLLSFMALIKISAVEMRYKPERALTQVVVQLSQFRTLCRRNEV